MPEQPEVVGTQHVIRQGKGSPHSVKSRKGKPPPLCVSLIYIFWHWIYSLFDSFLSNTSICICYRLRRAFILLVNGWQDTFLWPIKRGYCPRQARSFGTWFTPSSNRTLSLSIEWDTKRSPALRNSGESDGACCWSRRCSVTSQDQALISSCLACDDDQFWPWGPHHWNVENNLPSNYFR